METLAIITNECYNIRIVDIVGRGLTVSDVCFECSWWTLNHTYLRPRAFNIVS